MPYRPASVLSFLSNQDSGRSEPDFATHADTVPWYLRYLQYGTVDCLRYRRYRTVGTVGTGKKIKPKGCPVAMLRRLVAFAAWGVGGRAGSSPRPRFASMCIAAPSLAPKEREALARRCALHACSLSLTTAPRDPPLVLVSGLAAHQVGFFCGEQ